MNKNHHPNQTLIQFILRAQHLARQDARFSHGEAAPTDRGYAMMMTAVISIAMLSLLAAYMTIANLTKSSTNAYVDGNNTFYVAESGLNKRADEIRRKFDVSTLPTGTDPATMSECFPLVIASGKNSSTYNPNNDFECRNYLFLHAGTSATLKSRSSQNDFGGSTEVTNTTDNVNYVA